MPARLARTLVIWGALATLAPAACGDDEGESTATTTSGSDAGGECEQVRAPEPKDVKLKPPEGASATDTAAETTATVKTSCGDFKLSLNTEGSPKTVASFAHMVEEGLYEETTFHRVVEGFVIQGGDPAADGSGGPGYSVTEKVPIDSEYTRGTVAMAKTPAEPPGTSGSQFFVVTAADAGLPAEYAILGQLTAGEETVDAIEAEADPNLGPEGGPPQMPIVIERITLR